MISLSDIRRARILVVDDEPVNVQLLEYLLKTTGYENVSSTYDPRQVVALHLKHRFDLIILDLGLPGLDGIEVCRRVRAFSECYVLMLTARGDEHHRLEGLAVGADDYITKPFSVRELVARVGAVMRRPRTTVSAPEPERVCGDLVIDLAAHEARVSGQVVQLTRTEFDLLAALSGRPHQAFSRRQLIDIVWDPAWVGDERLVDVHIKNLRRKLDADPARYIDTVRGVGYRMAEQ